MARHRVSLVLLVAALPLLLATIYLISDPSPGHSAARSQVRAAASRPHPRYRIPEAQWGQVRTNGTTVQVILGPATDRRHERQLSFGRVQLIAPGISVSDDLHGKNAVAVNGSIGGAGCLFHGQGSGVNIVIAVGSCVPFWAHDGPGHRAREWIIVGQTSPRPRVVTVIRR